jgi:hypothetical protein
MAISPDFLERRTGRGDYDNNRYLQFALVHVAAQLLYCAAMAPHKFGFLALAVTLLALPNAHAQNRIDAAFQKFWAARSPAEAERMVPDVVKSGVPFDEALRRLKAGRVYKAEKTGVVMLNNKTKDGVEHFYALNIPPGYDPARRYQVRFQLHGGIGGRQDNKPRGTGEIGALAGVEQIYVIPYAWNEAPWWGEDQVLNLETIVDALKRTYNVDENRIVLAGVSDGGTGAYYIAMRETTRYATILPLNAFIMVLSNDDIDDGRIFPNNLRNKPLLVINGGQDPLYPIVAVEPFTKHLMSSGVTIAYYPQPQARHNTAWWPEMKDTIETFVADHPRDPHPEKLTWETASLEHNRAHWLVIDQLGPQPTDAKLPDANIMRSTPLFSRPQASGRVDLIRKGNTVEATTSGVSTFTLLLSPDRFDFSQPVKVIANGRAVFDGPVKPDLQTLLKWAARDNDRTMLYGAELKIVLRK